jgi:hypothetical protein
MAEYRHRRFVRLAELAIRHCAVKGGRYKLATQDAVVLLFFRAASRRSATDPVQLVQSVQFLVSPNQTNQ